MVEGGDKFHSPLFNCLLQFSHHIPFGPLLIGVPAGQCTIPHGKSIMVFGHRSGKLCTRLQEQLSPLIRIEFFRLEHADERFIPHFCRITKVLQVVLILIGSFLIHVMWIPRSVGAFGRHGIPPPVRVNSELCILKPLRGRMTAQGIPGRFIYFDLSWSFRRPLTICCSQK